MNEFDMLNWWINKNLYSIISSLLLNASIKSKEDINIEYLVLEVLDGAHGFKMSPIGQHLLSIYKNNFIPHIIQRAKDLDESKFRNRDIDNKIKVEVFKQISEYRG
ncbi:hypothetical protein JCM14036_16550 [Desulfotomaculum defluvii]